MPRSWLRCAKGACPSTIPGWRSWAENAAGRLAFAGIWLRRCMERKRCSLPPAHRRAAATACPTSMPAAEQVARALTGYTVIVTKSTVPVGTSRRIAEFVRAVRSDLEFDVASNPEFRREGNRILITFAELHSFQPLSELR
jgi:hypothetical protein